MTNRRDHFGPTHVVDEKGRAVNRYGQHRAGNAEKMRPVRVVILSTADFAAAAWTNKQHLARELARRLPVTYIESFGLRKPTLGASDLSRMVGRLRSSRADSTGPNTWGVEVVHPIVIPLHGVAPVRALNKHLVKRLPVEGDDAVLWTFSPVTYGLEDRFARTVYHSVDLLHAQHRSNRELCLAGEALLLTKADRVIASSSGVLDHLRSMGRDDVLLWENVADTGLYEAANETRKPRAVFAGNLTPSKVDFDLLRSLATAGVPVVVAGPTSVDGTSAQREMDDLFALPGIDYVGNLAPPELARVLASSMVGLIPYRLNAYTAGVFPMKVYEYLAAGLRVVSTALPSLERTASEDVVLTGGESFLHAVQNGFETWSEQAAARRRELARGHSWQGRGEQALTLIDGLFGR
jgi:teichuronic acid biosynthesis glycosyltransferase TuaH